jgi:hypothetical protein
VVSVQQIAADVRASVKRAQALFAASPVAATASADSLGLAETSTTAAGRRAAALSGNLADRHAVFATETARSLEADGRTEAGLQERLSRAAAATQRGAQRLEAVTERTGALAQEADSARTPAAQRAIVGALRAELSQARSVVTSTQQQAADTAGQIRELGYAHTVPGRGGPPLAPPTPTPPQPPPNPLEDGADPPPTMDGPVPQIGPFPVPPEVYAAADKDRLALLDDLSRAIQADHDRLLEQLIKDVVDKKCSTHDFLRGLAELLGAGASGTAGVLGAPETGGAALYVGISAALISGALAIDDLERCLR